MKMNYPFRFALIALLVGLAGWVWWSDGISRGLDLQGGASLTYQIDTSELPPRARDGALLNTVGVIEERINTLGLKDVKVDALPPDQFEVQFPGQDAHAVERIKNVLTRLGQLELRIVARDEIQDPERERRDRMGANYPGPEGPYEWVPARTPGMPGELVEIPEKEEEARVAELEAMLEDPAIRADASRAAEVERQLAQAREALREVVQTDVFTGNDLDPGALGVDIDYKNPTAFAVTFQMRSDRIANFADFTERNLHRPMAIVIDGKLNSAATINDVLRGQSVITGDFSRQEAQDLVTVLQSGSLEVGIELQSELAIGPSLGEASVRMGITASLIGLGLVLAAMVYMYWLPGLVAVLAVLMNVVLTMGILAYFGAELSLPGIAGVILSVAMAVDANILVNERIREEKAAGKSLSQAVHAGYQRAFWTIFDSNVTTLFVAAVLFFMTTGQVKGFATTLALGIITSMFTALYMTRTVFGWLVTKGLMTEMKMPKLPAPWRLSYMKVRLPMILLSVVLAAGGVFAFGQLDAEKKYDIEFLSGWRAVMRVEKPLELTDVRDRIAARYPDAAIITVKSETATREALDLTTSADSFQITIGNVNSEAERERVLAFLQEEFGSDLVPDGIDPIPAEGAGPDVHRFRLGFEDPIPEEQVAAILTTVEGVNSSRVLSVADRVAEVELVAPDLDVAALQANILEAIDASDAALADAFPVKSFVDPKTAEGHRDDAVKAVLLSLVFQVIYIYFRFHGASFGFGAVVALLHDVLITLGAIAVFGGLGLVNVKINLPIIAGILTVIGYSMNDKIVIFDRIRENLGRGRMNLSELIDLSINQTMARTIRTGLTTLLVLVVLFVLNYGQAASVLEGFSFIMIVGIVAGTYSSVFIASPMLLFLPWHYIRGRVYGKFWIAMAVTFIGLVTLLFATSPTTTIVGGVLAAAYPLYFLWDLVLWLLIEDADRALNTVLRRQIA